jgi:predicted metal-binding protein
MGKFEKYMEKAKAMGVTEAKIIDPKTVITGTWVRLKCQYGCGAYNQSLMCPPFSPPSEYTRNMLKEYSIGLLMYIADVRFNVKPIPNIKKIVAELERDMFLDGYYKAFGMGAGPCGFCRECDTTQACKYPSQARPSMEACGIDVYKTARNNGYKIEVATSEESPCSFLALILIE